MADEEFDHRRRKKGQKREKVSMDEFIRRKREAENIKVETDKPSTPEVQPSERASPVERSNSGERGNDRPSSEEAFPDLPLDSPQYQSDIPPPLPMQRKESRLANRKMSTVGQPASEQPGQDYKQSKQPYGQRRQSHHPPPRESADQSRPHHNDRRHAEPRQNFKPVRQTNSRKSVMSDVQSVNQDRQSAMADRKSVVSEIENDWQDGKTLAESNQYMFMNEIGCDVTCLVGPNEEIVAAHSYVLISRSFHFSKMLSQQMNHPNKVLAFPDVNPESFRNLLRYIYTDELELTVQSATALLPTSSKYGSKIIRQKCFKYLLSEMSSEIVCAILELAHEFDEPTVHAKCLHFIHVNATDTLNAYGFRNICRDCVEEIVDSDDLYADEMSVFNGLVTWANAECTRRKLQPTDKARREVLGKLLYCVRYSTMGVHDFTHKLSQNETITAEEKIVLYQYFHGKMQSLPQHLLKGNRRKRAVRPEVVNRGYQRSPNRSLPSPHESTVPYQSQQSNETHRKPEQKRVLRFTGMSGTWRNKEPDAIAFRCSESIGLLGIQIFGPPEGIEFYQVNVIVFDDVKNVVRNQDVSITTDASKVCDVILKDPVLVPSWKTFTIQVTIIGAPSVRGTDGVRFVNMEGVQFEFMASSKCFSGTDETIGQIPSLLFTKL